MERSETPNYDIVLLNTYYLIFLSVKIGEMEIFSIFICYSDLF